MNKKMDYVRLLLLLTLVLVACGGSSATDDSGSNSEVQVDPQTGLEINPDPIPASGQFIIEGTMVSNTLIPQSSPEFTIQSPAGKNYRMRSQALSAITYDDGTPVEVSGFVQGIQMRATVTVEGSDTSTLTTQDLTVIKETP